MPLTLLPLLNAEIWLDERFLPFDAATALSHELEQTIAWRQEAIRLYGREVLQPRLTAWHGDPAATYRYSGLQLTPQPWTPALQKLRGQVETATGTAFNSVLLNLYRYGQDSMGWHADDEPELGPAPVIASLSLGATRRFRLRPRDARETPHAPVSLDLSSGSLLVMRGPTQQHWLHAVPKTARPTDARLNLTFRLIVNAM
ncbi:MULTISPECIES: alpha-ketoglutarate-dependent dioxygenase AlkB family protein [Hymenobacter]|uniref:Alpha-ketoglutarate-dependent dioxygenase AlkB n=1 Tax=Hymenobacter profundi TaxID=1982110 RepID=A0ABS6X3R1_9BACT|nr:MULTISPECIES: alpha-ketoglutarate-dependent dioxygenase AlkB [Hymenobacter]MBW3130339.1 alpha-ketoglutarate-dependent dioxygenase AlkB [Hymenobacter profundi]QNE41297.1 alpha-ketoglutarate-dependent dioxygenase AlkB [Hymenobacter sp. NBH84]